MIKFEKTGSVVSVRLDVDVPWGEGTWNWLSTITFENRWSAGFWINAITTQLGERLRSIRQRAYDRGWADAKAKRAKARQCFTTLNDV